MFDTGSAFIVFFLTRLQEHADVSESLGRRLREEAEVNAALSQVSLCVATS